ncbi:Anaphase-promoting complex subunit 5 [Linum perenne]
MAAAGVFALTPHKVSVCILLQLYAPPAQAIPPSPFLFSSVSQHNRLGLYLLALTKAHDDFVEPKLEDLLTQLKEISGSLGDWLIGHLTNRFSSLSSPDDLANLFSEIRGILGGTESALIEANQVVLDPNSHLGMFIRRCVLTFNILSFEGVCHLLTNIGNYCKEALSSCLPYEGLGLDDSGNDLDTLSAYENMELENIVFQKVTEEIQATKQASAQISFHLHTPKALSGLVEDVEIVGGSQYKDGDKSGETCSSFHTGSSGSRSADTSGDIFLRTTSQLQGFVMEQAEAIEKHGSSFPLNDFELVLNRIKKLAPELYRVHFLHYLNCLYHDDYFGALENLRRFFDYSVGTDGFDIVPAPSRSKGFERYEIGLLCLGMLQFHFGHPRRALEQSNDSCLAYTLASICTLSSEMGSSSTSGVLGTSYSPTASIGTSLYFKQQLFVLLKESLKRAESLRLKRLVASNHLAMAKFDLMNVQRPLLSFGPKASMKLRTCPITVCKKSRLCLHLFSEYASESSTMTNDGAFSTSWLNNLKKPQGALVLSLDNRFGNSSNPFQFCEQPSSIPTSVLQLLGSSYLFRATAWEIYGSATLARMNSLVFATCYLDVSSSSDAALVHAKLIQHLATFKGYKDAFSVLKQAEEKFLSISRPVILLLKMQLLHERALHRGNLKLALQLCNELGVLASPFNGVDIQLKFEASMRHARTLLAAKQYKQASEVGQSLFCLCYQFNMQVENASVLLLLAEIHKKSGNAVLGLPYALASLSFCQSFNLDLLKASATVTLAELWLSLGKIHAKRALTLLHGSLPMVFGHGGLELRARARLIEAQCYLCDPNYSVVEDWEIVVDALGQACEEFEVLEVP